MITFGLKPVTRPPTAAKIDRNLRFGVAMGLTETAKQGQKAVHFVPNAVTITRPRKHSRTCGGEAEW